MVPSESEDPDPLKVQVKVVQDEVNEATGGTFAEVSRVMVKESVRVPPAPRMNEACSESSVATTSSAPQVGLRFRPEVVAK